MARRADEEVSVKKGNKASKASTVVVPCVDHLQLKPYESYFKEHLVSGFGWVKPEAWRTVCDCGVSRVRWNPKPF